MQTSIESILSTPREAPSPSTIPLTPRVADLRKAIAALDSSPEAEDFADDATKAAYAAYFASDETDTTGPLYRAYLEAWSAAYAVATARRAELESQLAASRAQLRDSDEPRTYMITYTDGSGVSSAIFCTPDDLGAMIESDVRSGDWSEDGTTYIDVKVSGEDGTVERRTIVIQPQVPSCTGTHAHDWQAPITPSVMGHGGGVRIHEVCSHCGAHRYTDTWAQRPDTGEQGLTKVTYEAPDDFTRAWVRSLTDEE